MPTEIIAKGTCMLFCAFSAHVSETDDKKSQSQREHHHYASALNALPRLCVTRLALTS